MVTNPDMMRRFFPSTIRQVDEAVGFVFEINTANTSTGSTTNTQFKLPLVSAGIYDFSVDWGDSTSDTITVWDVGNTHTYGATGTYTITITGQCEGWAFNNTGDRLKILDIQSWGAVKYLTHGTTANTSYRGCANLNFSATDSPDFSLADELAGFFWGCTNLVGNSSINDWNVSTLTTLDWFFYLCPNFNQPLGNWDMSNKTAINNMLRSCSSFNQDLSAWNVSNVTNFSGLFWTCPAFNQDIGMWDVSKASIFVNFMNGKTAATFSTTNLDAIYNGWSNRAFVNTGLGITFGTAKYTAAGTAGRALLARANSTVTVSNAVNNGSGSIRITTGAAHGRTTGDKIFISGVTGTTEANGAWIVTVIDATTVDFQGSTFTNTYVSGGTFRIGYGWSITDGGI